MSSLLVPVPASSRARSQTCLSSRRRHGPSPVRCRPPQCRRELVVEQSALCWRSAISTSSDGGAGVGDLAQAGVDGLQIEQAELALRAAFTARASGGDGRVEHSVGASQTVEAARFADFPRLSRRGPLESASYVRLRPRITDQHGRYRKVMSSARVSASGSWCSRRSRYPAAHHDASRCRSSRRHPGAGAYAGPSSR